MQENNFSQIINKQKQFFASEQTYSHAFRNEQLKKLQFILRANEKKIADALREDLGKAYEEAFITEIMLVQDELHYIIKHLNQWMQPQKTKSPFPILWPGRSQIYYEPYGVTLIISPWNYPFLLTMSPLIGAIAAGNCVIIKPSEHATQTQNLLLELINNNFSPHYIHVISGGPQETQQLLQQKFDYIFFTGSTSIGKKIMEAAAKHLTPITLELGGKSPCIVDASANLDFAARRIVWAKLSNAGQTCIAPDYLYVERKCKEKLLQKIIAVLSEFYGDDMRQNSQYPRIINTKHVDRLTQLLTRGKIITGGQVDKEKRYVAPTILDDVSWDMPVMQEEIFGPILPVLTYDAIDDVIKIINQHEKPLALYLFTHDKKIEKKVMRAIPFGGGCINDCLLQVANYYLPFGGVGKSGSGGYHGFYSFETFSHRKSVYKKLFSFETKLEYPPYTARKMWWLKKLMRQ